MTHELVVRKGPFGGTVRTTLCGRVTTTADGMNVSDSQITCKFCLKARAIRELKERK